MPHRQIRLRTSDGDSAVRAGLERVRAELKVPGEFSAEVRDEAATAGPGSPPPTLDLPFFTIDPAGSMDLDQAMHLERRTSGGHRVHYAIADVASFVRPGGAIDAEAHARGVTLYLPDAKAPLHPPELSEGAASLLPGEDRPAVVWTIDLDTAGEIAAAEVRRALVRSRERLDYTGAQEQAAADERIVLLGEIGELLLAAEAARGGVSLPLPEQEVEHGPDGWTLEFRGGLRTEQWNAQISLLTGRAAAQIMLKGGIGLLRTMPAPPAEAVTRLRRAALALGIGWPEGSPYGQVVRTLDPGDPKHAAFMHEATGLMRGAGYTWFDGRFDGRFGGGEPEESLHAAVAAPYAHVTAPLRRLADRYATEVCLALTSGDEVPEWVRAGLPELPSVMGKSLRHSSDVERVCVDLVEAVTLGDQVGHEFAAVVVDIFEDRPGGVVQLLSPAVLARCEGDGLPLGEPVTVRLDEADPIKRRVRFSQVC